jgi:hypothetical protein
MAKFPVPELSLKFFEMLCSLLVFSLIAGWESNNIGYKDLPSEYIAGLDFAVALGVVAFLYVIIVSIVIIVDLKFQHLYIVVRSREVLRGHGSLFFIVFLGNCEFCDICCTVPGSCIGVSS